MNETKKASSYERRLSARVMAVQAVFQMIHNNQDHSGLIEEYLSLRADPALSGSSGTGVKPDGALFTQIVKGVGERENDIKSLLKAHIDRGSLESLIVAILMCGVYELMRADHDKPLIINDYLDVTHGFFGKGEVALVNGVLDKVSQVLN